MFLTAFYCTLLLIWTEAPPISRLSLCPDVFPRGRWSCLFAVWLGGGLQRWKTLTWSQWWSCQPKTEGQTIKKKSSLTELLSAQSQSAHSQLQLNNSVSLLQRHFSCSKATKRLLIFSGTMKPAQVAFWLTDSEHPHPHWDQRKTNTRDFPAQMGLTDKEIHPV